MVFFFFCRTHVRVRHAEREHVVPFTAQMTMNAIVPMEALEEAVTQKAFYTYN